MPIELDPSQDSAIQLILGWAHASEKGWVSLCGEAGTGKTMLLANFILPEIVLNQKLKVAVATPTARAARVLASKLSSEVKAQLRHLGTIHSLMYHPVFDGFGNIINWKKKGHLDDIDIVVIDECSMVDEDMERDLESLEVPIIAVGDPFQLKPINGQSTWMQEPSVLLEQVHRQALDSPILRLAHYVKNNKKLPDYLHTYGVMQHLSLSQAKHSILQSYEDYGKSNTAIACYTNNNRCKVNTCIQRMLFGDTTPQVDTQIVCLRNYHQHAIYNGDRGVITAIKDHNSMYKTAIDFDCGNKTKDIQTESACFGQPQASKLLIEESRNLIVDYGYCLTAHKLQGSQFDEVFIIKDIHKTCDDYASWMYTAITRSINKLHFISRVGNFS